MTEQTLHAPDEVARDVPADTRIELVVLDMAGTTVVDDGVVERAFAGAADATDLTSIRPWDEALAYVRATMGQSKIEVFTALADGDRSLAARATTAFEATYARIAAEEGAAEIPGAGDAIAALRGAGRSVWLTTGFSPATRDDLLDRLPWGADVDGALSPADVGRGRPMPDLVLAAALRAQVSSMAAVAVVGDTASDVESGRRAGAGLVVGVTSGAHDHATLTDAGADVVLGDVTELPAALHALGR